jgi:hypothetical protein
MNQPQKPKSVFEDYEKIAQKDPLKAAYQAQTQQIDQQMNAEAQNAFILNEKLKKYLGTMNSAYGQNGLGATGQVAIANQYANNLGGIQQNANVQKNDAFSAYTNSIMKQNQIKDERAYEQSVGDQNYQRDMDLYNKQQQAVTSKERYGIAQEAIYNEYMAILSNYGSNKAIDKNQAYTALMNYASQKYGAHLNPEDMQNLSLYVDAILSGQQYGSKPSLTNERTDDYERDYTKKSSKYAYEIDGKTYYLDFSGVGEGYKVDNFLTRGKKQEVAQAVAYMLEKGEILTEADITKVTGIKNDKIVGNIMSDLETFLRKNNIKWE